MQGAEDPNVKWLEFVNGFRGEAVENDRRGGGIGELLHFRGFMQCMTVNDQENWSTAFVALLHKRDEDLVKPLSADVIVCPALVGGCDPKKDQKKGGSMVTMHLREASQLTRQSPEAPNHQH